MPNSSPVFSSSSIHIIFRLTGLYLLLLLMFLPLSTLAGEPDPQSSYFTRLFSSTCMKYAYNPKALHAELVKRNFTLMPEQDAAFFLRGKPGSAWPVTSKTGTYIIALEQTGRCSVFTFTGNLQSIEQSFNNVAAFPPRNRTERASKVQEKTTAVPSGSAKTIEYRWFRPPGNSTLQLMLITYDSPEADIRAMATTSVIRTSPSRNRRNYL